VRQVDTRDQGATGTPLARCYGNIAGTRWALVVPVWQQPACQRAVTANQHRRLRQDQVGKGFVVGIYGVVIPPRQIGHAGNQGNVVVIGGNTRYHAQIVRCAGKAEPDRLHLDVFQHGTRLFGHSLIIERVEVKYPGAIAGIGACHDRQGMNAHAGHRHDIGGQSTGTTGVVAVEDQYTGRCV